jgi:hypothetical protein
MHTVELLEAALQAARALDYRVRLEWLGGRGGGSCTVRGERHLFLDLAQGPAEQLEQVVDALRQDPRLAGLELLPALRAYVALPRRAA